MKKISVVLAVLLLIPAFPVAIAVEPAALHAFENYEDIQPGDWHYSYAVFAHNKGLIVGTDRRHFSPDVPVSRAMFVTILGRLAQSLGVSIDFSPDPGQVSFTDVDLGAYYGRYLAWAAQAGIVRGYSPDTFGPHDPMTREQIAVVLVDFAAFMEFALPGPPDDMDIDYYYEDASEWALAPLTACFDAGLFHGYSDGTTQPRRVATRAESAKLVYTLLHVCGVDVPDVSDEIEADGPLSLP